MVKQYHHSLKKARLKVAKGLSKFQQSKYLEAAKYFEEAIKLLPSDNDKLLSELLHQRGWALQRTLLWNLSPKTPALVRLKLFKEAESCYKKSLVITEKVYGKDHPEFATTLSNLAILYEVQGNLVELKRTREELLAVQEKILGKEHPAIAEILNSIANLSYMQGDYAQAKALYERALAIPKVLNEEFHLLTISSTHFLTRANLSHIQGDYIHAEEFYKCALNLEEKIFGKEHPTVAVIIQNLGKLHYQQNNFDQVEHLYDQSVAIFEKTVGIEHPNCATLFSDIANLYRDQGKHVHAQQLYEKALMILKKAFDSEHPQVSYVSKSLLELEKRIIELEKQKNEQQAELEQKRRLAFLGEMSTAIAHQINQPVGIIRASTGAALDDMNHNLFHSGETKPLLDKIWQQTERLHKIIDTFRRFARGDRTIREPVNINLVIQQTIELFSEQFKQHHIELILQLTEENLIVHANSSLLQEILINLLTNARDALKNQNNATVWITSWQQDNMAHFQVSDNGPGIPETIRPHIFTPFHSTKSTEHGTGLGLYICDKVIKELNGTISYTDRPEGGGCFSITLPQLME